MLILGESFFAVKLNLIMMFSGHNHINFLSEEKQCSH